jgi:hypothetical protein
VQLVGDQQISFAGGQPGQRRGDDRAFLPPQEALLRILGAVEVGGCLGEQVALAPSRVVVTREGRHQVSRRHRGVRRKRVPLDPVACGEDTKEGLLDEVLDQVRVPNPRPDDLAHHGRQLHEDVVEVVLPLRGAPYLHHDRASTSA